MLARHEEGKLQQAYEALLNYMVQEIHDAVAEAVSPKWPEEVNRSLRQTFKDSVEFFRMLRRHPARFTVDMLPAMVSPAEIQLFDPTHMMDENNEDGGELLGRSVQMSLFPAVYKWGDERGDNVSLPSSIFVFYMLTTILQCDIKTVVSKAKVLMHKHQQPA